MFHYKLVLSLLITTRVKYFIEKRD